MTEFEWTCGKREAHDPHREKVETTKLGDPEPTYIDGRLCPGVKAHPDTMIGRSG